MKTGTIIASKRASSSCQDTKRKSKYKKENCNIGPTRSLTEKPGICHEGLRLIMTTTRSLPLMLLQNCELAASNRLQLHLNYGIDREVKYVFFLLSWHATNENARGVKQNSNKVRFCDCVCMVNDDKITPSSRYFSVSAFTNSTCSVLPKQQERY